MKSAEFEEKEYEGPLYRQLLGDSHRISTPGQVFEFAFGVDACLEALSPAFWNAVGKSTIPGGAVLDDLPLSWVWAVFGSKRKLPTFSLNLLIQAKRPDFLHGARGDFRSNGINGSYWRFYTMAHQQKALSRLSEEVGTRAMVVYAAPAFHRRDDLYKHTDEGSMVENSTFPAAEKLKGHRSWNYDRPGTSGIAASVLSSYTGPDFRTVLEEQVSKTRSEDASSDLMAFAAAIDKTVESLKDNPIAVRYRDLLERASQPRGIKSETKPEVEAFQRSLLFADLLGLKWLVAGP